MALKLVTAPPGTGKTLLLIKLIFEYLKQGRRVYANIDQLKIEEVLPIPHNADWRDLPDGSVVIYDEAQEHAAFSNDDLLDFPEFIEPEQLDNEPVTVYRTRLASEKKVYDRAYKKYAESIKDIARGFQIHRHFGFDIILATQDQSLLNNLAKKCVGEHYHLTRPFGLKGNMIFFWRRLQTNPDSSESKRSAEYKKHINFNKSYFKLYRSANVHTHNASIPAKYIAVLCLIAFLVCLPFYLLSKSTAVDLLTGEKTMDGDVAVDSKMPADLSKPFDLPDTQQTQNEPKPEQISVSTPVVVEKQISGCIKFAGKYHAYDKWGRPVRSKDHLCYDVVELGDRSHLQEPIPTSYRNTTSADFASEDQQKTDDTVMSQREQFNEF